MTLHEAEVYATYSCLRSLLAGLYGRGPVCSATMTMATAHAVNDRLLRAAFWYIALSEGLLCLHALMVFFFSRLMGGPVLWIGVADGYAMPTCSIPIYEHPVILEIWTACLADCTLRFDLFLSTTCYESSSHEHKQITAMIGPLFHPVVPRARGSRQEASRGTAVIPLRCARGVACTVLQLFGTIERSRIPAVRRGVSQTASALWNFMFSSRLRTGTLP